eukprot:753411-Hanusia_phi.AAC.4
MSDQKPYQGFFANSEYGGVLHGLIGGGGGVIARNEPWTRGWWGVWRWGDMWWDAKFTEAGWVGSQKLRSEIQVIRPNGRGKEAQGRVGGDALGVLAPEGCVVSREPGGVGVINFFDLLGRLRRKTWGMAETVKGRKEGEGRGRRGREEQGRYEW